MKGEKVNLRLPPKPYAVLKYYVEQGYFSNINDAIRNAVIFYLTEKPWLKMYAKTPLEELQNKQEKSDLS
jgi:Arc/MetJ-type ribon-helix-helix transcriptional regulator